MKKRLTQSEEFDVMKLVLDKFLWLGVVFMGIGLYKIITDLNYSGFYEIVIGAVVMIVFALIIIREYEVIAK